MWLCTSPVHYLHILVRKGSRTSFGCSRPFLATNIGPGGHSLVAKNGLQVVKFSTAKTIFGKRDNFWHNKVFIRGPEGAYFWQPTLVQGVTLWLPKMVFKLSNLVPLRQFLARGTIFGTTKCSSGDQRGRIFGNQNRSSGIFGVIQQRNIFPFLSHRPELSL